MSLWFRFYESTLDDPKVQKLKPELFKAWVNLLALASRHGGDLPSVPDCAFALRVSEDKAASWLWDLNAAGLMDKTETGYAPHNWASRQFKSDVSNERVKRHRERQRNASCNVTETPSESEQNRTDIAASKPAPDLMTLVFTKGVEYLRASTGRSEGSCRSVIGKWRKSTTDEALIKLLGDAQRQGIVEPVSWIEGAINQKPKAGAPARFNG